MNLKRSVAVWLVGLVTVGVVGAQETAAPTRFTMGGSFRLRQEAFDNLPIRADPPGVTRGGPNNYIRFRSQLWSQYELHEKVTLYGRLCNEFRHYYDPDSNTGSDFPDELIVDNLYVDFHHLLADESLAVRIGRQDLFFGPGRPFGNGRLILEGTPKDGSRTIYFDAVRATWKKGATQVDAIGLYNRADGEFLINDQDRDLTGYTSAYNDMDEYGGMLHAAFAATPDLGAESYYLYKVESRWDNGALRMPKADLHTVGGRLAPRFSDRLSGSLEAAFQIGERGGQDLRGYMVDALVKAVFLPDSAAKPWASAGCLYFSGDDPDSTDDEGWNPLWARYPQFGLSDLLIYTYDADGAGRWSNLAAPYLSAGFVPHRDARLSLMVSHLLAPENDGPGSGDQRGWYAGASYQVVLARAPLAQRDELKGHLQAELLEPGDYYARDRHTGYFLRWELCYSF